MNLANSHHPRPTWIQSDSLGSPHLPNHCQQPSTTVNNRQRLPRASRRLERNKPVVKRGTSENHRTHSPRKSLCPRPLKGGEKSASFSLRPAFHHTVSAPPSHTRQVRGHESDAGNERRTPQLILSSQTHFEKRPKRTLWTPRRISHPSCALTVFSTLPQDTPLRLKASEQVA